MTDEALEAATRQVVSSMSGFRLADLVMIGAVVLAPLVALQVSAALEAHRAKRERKEYIFRTLIATRANTLSERHVEALNLIDLYFYHVDPVRSAWRLYMDHLNTPSTAGDQWGERRIELLTALLHTMSTHLGYKFDLVHLRRAVYSPQAHGDSERDWTVIRAGLAQVLSHNMSIPIELTTLPMTEEQVRERDDLHAIIQGVLRGERELAIRVSGGAPETSALAASDERQPPSDDSQRS